MKLEILDNKEEIELIGQVSETDVSISKKDEKIFLVLTLKGLYSNPIGSVIRELASNCFDANVENNISVPYIIEFKEENEEYFLKFKDYGKGMSPDTIEKVYNQVGNSTRRESNNFLGAFGLGSKSPFSYCNDYIVETIYEGKKYIYSLFIQNNIEIKNALLSVENTQEKSGTSVIIHISKDDVSKVNTELEKQLAYFKNHYVESDYYYDNSFKLYEGKTFIYKYPSNFTELHIVLGSVNYPINWKILDIPPITVPVGVKFNVGELTVTLSREQIDYKPETISIIKKRILEFRNEIQEKYNDQKRKALGEENTLFNALYNANLILDKNVSINISSLNLKGNLDDYTIKILSCFYMYEINSFYKRKKQNLYLSRNSSFYARFNVYKSYIYAFVEDTNLLNSTFALRQYKESYRYLVKKPKLKDIIKEIRPSFSYRKYKPDYTDLNNLDLFYKQLAKSTSIKNNKEFIKLEHFNLIKKAYNEICDSLKKGAKAEFLPAKQEYIDSLKIANQNDIEKERREKQIILHYDYNLCKIELTVKELLRYKYIFYTTDKIAQFSFNNVLIDYFNNNKFQQYYIMSIAATRLKSCKKLLPNLVHIKNIVYLEDFKPLFYKYKIAINVSSVILYESKIINFLYNNSEYYKNLISEIKKMSKYENYRIGNLNPDNIDVIPIKRNYDYLYNIVNELNIVKKKLYLLEEINLKYYFYENPIYTNWVLKRLKLLIPKLNPEFYTDHIIANQKLLKQSN